jgi:hypothetical protein
MGDTLQKTAKLRYTPAMLRFTLAMFLCYGAPFLYYGAMLRSCDVLFLSSVEMFRSDDVPFLCYGAMLCFALAMLRFTRTSVWRTLIMRVADVEEADSLNKGA